MMRSKDVVLVLLVLCVALRHAHYENTPIHIQKISLPKTETFKIEKKQKKTLIFFVFLLKTDCGYSLEPPRF